MTFIAKCNGFPSMEQEVFQGETKILETENKEDTTTSLASIS
jgi:hypothetical protein